MVNTDSLDNAGLGFALVTAAGLSTALGAAAVFEQRVVKMASKQVLAAGLGFSGGVMIYVSFVEIFGKSQDAFLSAGKTERDAYYCATLCLFAGMLLLQCITWLVHMIDKDHHCANDADAVQEAQASSVEAPGLASNTEGSAAAASSAEENVESGGTPEAAAVADDDKKRLQRMGVNTAIAIGIHNFPEGLATFVATLAEPAVGVTLAIAIGVHNIPEGLCVALPIYYATGSRLRGFLWALLSGISEPVGALIGYLIIKGTGDDMNADVYGVLFGVVGGMMIMIVILEMLPTAYKYDPTDRFTTRSFVAGMLVMALSLCLFIA